jgi:hypothetical protein
LFAYLTHDRGSTLADIKDQLPATIQQAEVTADQRAPNVVPALIADLGDEAAWRYVEFFTANIRNPNTRRAYARACNRFFARCEDRGLTPAAIRAHDVATYIEELQIEVSAPSVKQQLAAIRMLFDWLVIGQVVPNNPAAAVRGPKHVVKTGSTPVLEGSQMAQAAAVDTRHDPARYAGPRIDCHPHLFFRADRRGAEYEGRGFAATRRRMVDPTARERWQAAHHALSSCAG